MTLITYCRTPSGLRPFRINFFAIFFEDDLRKPCSEVGFILPKN